MDPGTSPSGRRRPTTDEGPTLRRGLSPVQLSFEPETPGRWAACEGAGTAYGGATVVVGTSSQSRPPPNPSPPSPQWSGRIGGRNDVLSRKERRRCTRVDPALDEQRPPLQHLRPQPRRNTDRHHVGVRCPDPVTGDWGLTLGLGVGLVTGP